MKAEDINKIDSDVEAFLNFRKKFTRAEWSELNHVIELVEKNRADQVKLTDSDVEKTKNRLTSNHIIHSSRFVSTPEEEKFDSLMDAVDKLDVWNKSKH